MRSMALLAPLVLLLWVKGLPAEAQLLEKVSGAPQYKTLVDLLTAANLTSTLSTTLQSGTQVTIFAPNNTAFSGLNATCLTSSANLEVLKTILLYHVAPMKVLAPTNGQIIATLANQTLTITINGSSIFANKELVTAPVAVDDPQGVVHGLASVLIPPTGGFAEAVTGCLLVAPKPGAAPASPPPPTTGKAPTPAPAPAAPAPSAASVLLVKSSAVLSLVAATAMAMLF